MEEKEYTFTGDLTDLIYDHVEAGDLTANDLQNDIDNNIRNYNFYEKLQKITEICIPSDITIINMPK